ncbi:flagellar hook associated protein [Rhizobium sp. XQZ8]|uniref:flagellin N-terminal helical domain-containing protein n=1 Tax=Rhizobium populisoli TaxID=2859785 RepID=UPI001CA5447F|nr:flagellin [Rhizobium populisoli]MBW6421577.1 flagellar hook associated protein [Rhizobium populisoli]
MSSILTNAAAVAALQTLRYLSSQLTDTQQQVSTGLRIGKAADNSAYWSIATTMRSDNGAIGAVQDALGLGAAQVDSAYAGMEASIDVVQEIKKKLVAALEPGVDKTKIQEEITQLQGQLRSISASASFSGDNWLQADISGRFDTNSGDIYASSEVNKQIVGSFTRDAKGNVSVKTISVSLNENNVLFDLSGGDAGLLDANVLKGVRLITDTLGQDRFANIDTIALSAYNHQYKDLGGNIYQGADSNGNYALGSQGTYYKEVAGGYVPMVFSTVANDYAVSTGAFATGALSVVGGVSVSELDLTRLDDYRELGGAFNLGMGFGTFVTDNQLIGFLVDFTDKQLEKMTSAAAKLGSVSMRISIQQDYASKLTDSIDRGIGRLVDAEMNEASTRLKALQTQQQLATQSLSIANNDSQNILSLFRQ